MEFRHVDPGLLRLPSGRQNGAVRSRYQRQVRQFGANATDMPSIEVTEGQAGELMINGGVTRATRIQYLAPGQTVPVEIIDVRPAENFLEIPSRL